MDIKIGDTVEIIDNGKTYTTYHEMFKSLGFMNHVDNPDFENGNQCVVFAKQYCTIIHKQLFAVRDALGNECLISDKGIKLIRSDEYPIY